MEVVIGDYSAKKTSWLKELEELSTRAGRDGLFHSGSILWVQSYLMEKGFDGFVLKAAIAPVLDAVPSVFPKDLPQQVDAGKDDATPEMMEFINGLNEGLILPVGGGDVVDIIRAAQEFGKEVTGT